MKKPRTRRVFSAAASLLIPCFVCANDSRANAAPAETAVPSTPGDPPGTSAPNPVATEPFAWGDFTWLNGTTRQHASLLDSKYFTGTFTMDVNYNYS